MRVERADRIPIHARPPQRMARQVGVARIAEDLAVDLQIGAGAPLVPPERVFAERAVLGVEVILPQRGRLDDMAVGVEYREILLHQPLLPPLPGSALRS